MSGFLITLAVFVGLLLYGVLAGVTFGLSKRYDIGDANDRDPIGMFFASMLWPIGLGVVVSMGFVKQLDPRTKERELDARQRAEREQAWHERDLARARAEELYELDRALARLEKEKQREV